MSKRIIIKKVNNHLIDVFHGEEGFEESNWTRLLLIKGYLKFIKGSQLSPHDFNAIKKELEL